MAVPHGVGSVLGAGARGRCTGSSSTVTASSPNLYNATGNAGNQRMMLYVNEGLKNTTCSPTFTHSPRRHHPGGRRQPRRRGRVPHVGSLRRLRPRHERGQRRAPTARRRRTASTFPRPARAAAARSCSATTSRRAWAGRRTRTAPTPRPPEPWERGNPEATTSSGTKQLGTTPSGVNDLVTGPPGRRVRRCQRHRRRRHHDPVAGDHAAGDGHADPDVQLLPGARHQLLERRLLPRVRRERRGHRDAGVPGAGRGRRRRRGLRDRGAVNLNAFAGQTVRIRFQAADAATASLVEAGVDDVTITRQ